MIYISHFTNEERKKYRQNNLPTVKQAERKSRARVQGSYLLVPVVFCCHVLSSAFSDPTSLQAFNNSNLKIKLNEYIIKIL